MAVSAGVAVSTWSVDIWPTCNLRCVYCRNDWSVAVPASHLQRAWALDTVRMLAARGAARLVYTGGEFFSMPHWRDVLTLATSLGIQNRIVTNATLVGEGDIPFLRAHVAGVNVSFHAADRELYVKVMRAPPGAFDRAVAAMRAMGEAGIPITVFFSPVQENWNALLDTATWLVQAGVRLAAISINRILPTESTVDYFRASPPLTLAQHARLLEQLVEIRKRFGVPAFAEAYPLCFAEAVLGSGQEFRALTTPCILGRTALAMNTDRTIKLCPATGFSLGALDDSERVLTHFREAAWRGERCRSCTRLEACGAGCHASRGAPCSDDALVVEHPVRLERGIDPVFAARLRALYEPFLSPSFERARDAYSVYAEGLRRHPVGIVALKAGRGGARFVEVALIPEAQGRSLGWWAVRALMARHPSVERFGWTAHTANAPSFRLLRRLGGGFFARAAGGRRVQAEGFFRRDGTLSRSMADTLEALLPAAEARHEEWRRAFATRTEEREALRRHIATLNP